MSGLRPAHMALGALIAARRAQIGVHVIECAPGQFDVVLRLSGPRTCYEDALREARWLAEAIDGMLPGPPNTLGARNPRPLRIRPIPAPPRGAK